MSGQTDLTELISNLQPTLDADDFVFVILPEARYGGGAELEPIASFQEREGLTLVVRKGQADQARLSYHGCFRKITLQVHSSLQAVGLTAIVATSLRRAGISANVIAAFHHDHVFVPAERSEEAIRILSSLTDSDPS